MALNTSFSAAKGDVIVLQDGDDMALEKSLELIVQAFRRRHAEAITTLGRLRPKVGAKVRPLLTNNGRIAILTTSHMTAPREGLDSDLEVKQQ